MRRVSDPTSHVNGNAPDSLSEPAPLSPNVADILRLRGGRHRKTRTMDPRTFVGGFDLVDAVRDSRFKSDDSDPWLSLLEFPKFIVWNIERAVAGVNVSRETALAACLDHGVSQLRQHPVYVEWLLEHETATTAHYEDSEDFSLVKSLMVVVVPNGDMGTGFSRRNFRCPKFVRNQINDAASKLTMKAYHLARICIMDGLRWQPTIIDDHRTVMDHAVEDLYRRIEKQTRRVKYIGACLRSLPPPTWTPDDDRGTEEM